MEEYEVARSSDTNLKALYYLGELNTHWKRYDALERGQTGLSQEERDTEKYNAQVCYLYAELKLIELGWRWDKLDYDGTTKTYSFPETVEAKVS